jgi:signal transduction histidine kinase
VTLQRRVLAYLALAAIASCALTVGVAVVLVRHRIASQRMTALVSQADLVALVGGAPGALTAGDHVYRVGSGRPRRVRPRISQAVLAALPTTGDGQGTITVDGRALMYAARTSYRGRVVLLRSARLAFAEWRPFLVSLVLAGPDAAVTVPVDGEDELAQLGRSFNAMAADLERARESQRSFLESVSHELKTPLTSIRGYAEALDEGAVSPETGGRVIAAEAGRLERLVFDLLDLARLDRAGFEVARRPVDLAAVGSAAIQRHLPRARELGLELTSSSTGDVNGAWGVGDEGRLLQATSNLIENALRLTPAGGRVTVSARTGEITVRDTGPGLAEEDLPHAFERFYLYDRYRSERAVGSGLGLAIVKELIGAMGGSVTAANGADGGAQFTLSVPPAPAPG